ncbi:MAG TPA: hypothetical protein VF037_00085, partial [Gemmatimonadales bacterium]
HPGYREPAVVPAWIGLDGSPIEPADGTEEPAGFLLAGPPRLLVLLNRNEAPRRMTLPGRGPWKDALGIDPAARTGHLELEGLGIAVLEEQAAG